MKTVKISLLILSITLAGSMQAGGKKNAEVAEVLDRMCMMMNMLEDNIDLAQDRIESMPDSDRKKVIHQACSLYRHKLSGMRAAIEECSSSKNESVKMLKTKYQSYLAIVDEAEKILDPIQIIYDHFHDLMEKVERYLEHLSPEKRQKIENTLEPYAQRVDDLFGMHGTQEEYDEALKALEPCFNQYRLQVTLLLPASLQPKLNELKYKHCLN